MSGGRPDGEGLALPLSPPRKERHRESDTTMRKAWRAADSSEAREVGQHAVHTHDSESADGKQFGPSLLHRPPYLAMHSTPISRQEPTQNTEGSGTLAELGAGVRGGRAKYTRSKQVYCVV